MKIFIIRTDTLFHYIGLWEIILRIWMTGFIIEQLINLVWLIKGALFTKTK